jgi:CRISPR type I-E-associated protein CasB/Cse2
VTATEEYIRRIKGLKEGELGLLRTHTGQGLDESVEGFDLFAGVWWPLREKSQNAPRREVAWLIAKLYAFRPIEHSTGETLPRQLRRCQPNSDPAKERFRQKFDRLLLLPLENLESPLQWTLEQIASKELKVDWVQLTNDISRWEREKTRLKWAEQYLEQDERE